MVDLYKDMEQLHATWRSDTKSRRYDMSLLWSVGFNIIQDGRWIERSMYCYRITILAPTTQFSFEPLQATPSTTILQESVQAMHNACRLVKAKP